MRYFFTVEKYRFYSHLICIEFTAYDKIIFLVYILYPLHAHGVKCNVKPDYVLSCGHPPPPKKTKKNKKKNALNYEIPILAVSHKKNVSYSFKDGHDIKTMLNVC